MGASLLFLTAFGCALAAGAYVVRTPPRYHYALCLKASFDVQGHPHCTRSIKR